MATEELTELAEATEKLREHTDDLIADWNKPLTFKAHGYTGEDRRVVEGRRKEERRIADLDVTLERREPFDRRESERREESYGGPPYHTIETGILWIPGPFVNKFWPDRKPVKPKHACPECGAKHAIRKVA